MGCQDCPYQGSVIVKNTGSKISDVVFVGEAPGPQEVSEKTPFVGPTGILLREILQYVGITGASFANSMRCCIDDKTNTKKVNAGLRSCKEYLENFITAIQPKLIVALGDIAMRQVLGIRKITENRGKFFDSSELGKVFVTFHPAYMLRMGMAQNFQNQTDPNIQLYLNDFIAVQNYLKSGKVQGIVTNNYRKVSKVVIDSKAIGFDVETTVAGGPPRKETRLLSFGVSDTEGSAQVVVGSTVPASVKNILESGKVVKYVAARPFDETILKNRAGIVMKNVHDVLTMAHILNENMPRYNLESVTEVYGNMKGIKSLSEGMRMNLEEAEERVLVQYNGVDADATLRVGRRIASELKGRPTLYRYYAKFMYPVQNMFSEISYHGCQIDTVQLRKNEQEALRMIDAYEQEALDCIPDRIKNTYKDNLKLSRNDLIIDFLFRSPYGLRLDPIQVTPKTKVPAVTEEHFKYLPQDITFIQQYLKYKRVSKIYNTYISNLWEDIHDDGRVYPSTLFTRTVTGRTVMLHPAIQTIPQRGEFAPLVKSAFVADRGWYLGARDLAQSELRIIGWLAGDPNILGALRDGIDLHTKTAMVVTGKPISDISKLDRQRAKPVGFGYVYGMQANKFKAYAKANYNVDFTQEEAEEFRRRFFSAPNGYYRLPIYHAEMIRKAQQLGYVESVLGRRRNLIKIGSKDRMERGEAERQAINFPVQSFSSDLGLLGMMLFWEEVKTLSLLKDKVRPMWFIHDAILFQAKEKVFDRAMRLLKECMEERAPEYIKKNFGVTLGYVVGSDGKRGLSWASMEDYHV